VGAKYEQEIEPSLSDGGRVLKSTSKNRRKKGGRERQLEIADLKFEVRKLLEDGKVDVL